MDEERGLFGPQPSVRRMCVAVACEAPGLLASVCRAGDFDRMLVAAGVQDGVELAVAPPGVDEVGLVRDLVADLREQAAAADQGRTVLLALHVGIIRLVADGFGGAGITVVRELATHQAVRRAIDTGAAADGPARLAVVLSEGLFADLRTEGLVRVGWQRVPKLAAWLHIFDPRRRAAAFEPRHHENSPGADGPSA